MPDMLVKLYNLPNTSSICEKLKASGIEIKRAIAPEKHIVVDWVRKNFGEGWGSECDVAFSKSPVSCHIATYGGKVIGFGCYDATCKDYFGPTGVDENFRGKGIGRALLLTCLESLRDAGYAYAIIGGAGPVDFYAKEVGAIVIEDSYPGIYKGMVRE